MRIGDQRIDPIPCHICDEPVPVGDWELHLNREHSNPNPTGGGEPEFLIECEMPGGAVLVLEPCFMPFGPTYLVEYIRVEDDDGWPDIPFVRLLGDNPDAIPEGRR